MNPIGIDENDMVLEGHGRLIALKELGETEADCIQITHLTTEEKKGLHNRTQQDHLEFRLRGQHT